MRAPFFPPIHSEYPWKSAGNRGAPNISRYAHGSGVPAQPTSANGPQVGTRERFGSRLSPHEYASTFKPCFLYLPFLRNAPFLPIFCIFCSFETLCVVININTPRNLTVEKLLVGQDGLIKLCDFGSCSVSHGAFLHPKARQAYWRDAC